MENKKYIQYLKAIGGYTEEEFNEILKSFPPFDEFCKDFYINLEENTLEFYILRFGCLKDFPYVYLEDFNLQTKEIWLNGDGYEDSYEDSKNFMEKYGWKVHDSSKKWTTYQISYLKDVLSVKVIKKMTVEFIL